MTKLGKVWLVVIAVILFLFIVLLSIKLFNNPKSNPKSVIQKETEQTQAWTWSSIEQAEAEIMSMVDNHRYTEAKRAINQLISVFSQDSQLPKSLFWIAERYRWSDEPEESTNLYNKIMQDYPQSPYVRKAEINIAREQTISLIKKNDYTGAQKTVNSMLFKFSGDPDLAESLYWIADGYYWSEKYDEAKKLYQEIVWNYPKSSYVDKARLGLNRAEIGILREGIISFIQSKDYVSAQKTLDKLIAKFTGNQDLPDALYWIADKYYWSEKYTESKKLYERILYDYPSSSYASKAKMRILREEITSLIKLDDYFSAQKALDKLIANFANEPDLPDELCRIADTYHWKEQYGDSKNLFEMVMRKYPNNSSLNKAKMGFAREEISSLIDLENYTDAQKAIDKLITDFTGDPNLPETLYWIAEKYGWMGERSKWMGVHDEAKDLYRRIIQDYPNSPYSSKAKLNFAREEVMSLFASGNNAGAQKAFNKMLTDFADNPNLEQSVYEMGAICFIKAELSNDKGDTEVAEKYYKNSIEALEGVIREFSDADLLPSAYFIAGSCYSLLRLGEHRKAIDYFQKVADTWPNHKLAGDAQYLMAECYKKLMDSDVLLETESFPQMEKAYKTVIEKYPECRFVNSALIKLGRVKFEQGKFSEAIECFEMVLKRKPINICIIGSELKKAYEKIGDAENAFRVQSELEKNCKV